MNSLSREFYLQDTLQLSKELLGKYMVRTLDKDFIIGRILETEAYIGRIDKACHAYGGKRTKRVEILYGIGGYSYVYLIYGMYNCFNVVAEKEGEACAVLVRGVEIVKGMDYATDLRYGKKYNELTRNQIKNISNGPGKLCIAMDITRDLNGKDLCNPPLFITDKIDGVDNTAFTIKESKRIGIDYAEEAVDFLWRFELKKSSHRQKSSHTAH